MTAVCTGWLRDSEFNHDLNWAHSMWCCDVDCPMEVARRSPRSAYEIAAELREQSAREANERLRFKVASDRVPDLEPVRYQPQTMSQAQARAVEAAEKARRALVRLMSSRPGR